MKNENDLPTGKDVLLFLSAGTIVGGIGVLIYQIIFWLSKGYWQGMSVLYPFYEKWDWALYPNSWIGVHKILDNLPLWLGLVIFGGIFIVIMARVEFKK